MDLDQDFSFEDEGAVATARAADPELKQKLALQMLKHMQQSLTHLIQLLEQGDVTRATRDMVNMVVSKKRLSDTVERQTGAHAIEGVFDGVHLVTQDGVRHAVPENYASKSKLVEGDMLKMVVRADGSQMFKQISPVERRRLTGVFDVDPLMNTPIVTVGEDVYKILPASASYHRCIPGDEVTILIPGAGRPTWAALERVTHS